MSPVQSVSTVLRKYAVFSGRARRSELWWYLLFYVIVLAVALALDAALFGTGEATTTSSSVSYQVNAGPVSWIVLLALFLPTLGAYVRRLHDTGRTGWWVLLGIIPFFGTIVLIVFYVLDSTPGSNRFGPSPKQGTYAG